jgi:hypothetical protein
VLFAALVFALGLASPTLAAPPPADAKPLSQILQSLEQQGDVTYFDEVEWDDDGYWEIEYFSKAGTKTKLRVDPISGQRR